MCNENATHLILITPSAQPFCCRVWPQICSESAIQFIITAAILAACQGSTLFWRISLQMRNENATMASHLDSTFGAQPVCVDFTANMQWTLPSFHHHSSCRGQPFLAQYTQRIYTQTPWWHTLAQNNLCEFWCGMHLTCKNTQITPDTNELMKRPEKEARSNHRRSHC